MKIRGLERSIWVYDFEVFSKADFWMLVLINYETKEKVVIVNNKNELKNFYDLHKDDIFVGYNSRGYDIWIFKGILLGMNPCFINDEIIEKDKKGYQIVKNAKKIQFYNFDVADILHSLKEYELYMGDMIKESDVPFNLDRELTKEEIDEVIFYCTHDVEETIKVFDHKKKDFDAHLLLIETFELDMSMFNKTKAQLSAHILQGVKQSRIDDEFDYIIQPNLKLDKYKHIVDWYLNPRNKTYGRKLTTNIAGVEHVLGFGGIHSAIPNYKGQGIFAHADVASLYPSLMIVYNLLSRNVKDPAKFKEIKDKRLELKKLKDPKQGALKIVINATYGISKDRNSSLYDPAMANNICITGQLFNVDLVEKIEGCGQLIQNNTDGVVLKFDNMEQLEKAKELAHEWEVRTGLELEWEMFDKIYQRDVNNYIIVNSDGTYESKGCVNEKKGLNYNLPVITKSIIEYCTKGTPIEDYINNENKLIEFQMSTKATALYKYSFYGTVKQIEKDGKKCTVCDEGFKVKEKINRVFASKDENDKCMYKVKNEFKVEKISGVPDHLFIDNGDIHDKLIPDKLNKQWYIDLANDTLSDFLGEHDKKEDKESPEQQLIKILNKKYESFYDVLEDIKINTKINKSQLVKYITIDAFKQYGKTKKLIEYYDLFNILYNKKSAKGTTLKKKITNEDIFMVLQNNSDYNEEKDNYSKLDSKQALIELFDIIPNDDISPFVKVKQEFDLYDDISMKDSTVNENIIFIMNVNETHNPSIIAYNLKYGTTNVLKIPKNIFNILELKEQDFVLMKNIENRPKVKVVGKDEDGINIIGNDSNDKEWWLTQYEILERDYNKNNKLIDEEVCY